ncbi:YecH family metal-binding protein [Agaribacterium sp. ZY112]|uniref:YecH family metal-binding protein n=1 Tax=Agaribacterium sp. ZY112 TaxID=3233574 RepID=UPI0035257A74
MSQHVHDILDIIKQSGKNYSVAELKQAITSEFGSEATFASCSTEGMNIEQAIEFIISKGKFVPEKSGVCCGGCGG